MKTNILFTSTLQQVLHFLQKKPFYTPRCLYADRFVIKEKKWTESSTIRIWKSKSLLDWWYNDSSSDTFIGGLNYRMHEDHVKCEYMNIKDVREPSYGESPSLLTEAEIAALSHSFVEHLKKISREENKPKIIIDVHQNLRIYEKYYKKEGFHITERQSIDNPFWIEAELPVPPDECIL